MPVRSEEDELKLVKKTFQKFHNELRKKKKGEAKMEKSVGNRLVFVSGPVCRGYLPQTLSKRSFGVCAAASTAASINIVREGLSGLPIKTWAEILFEKFHGRLGRVVVTKGGRLTTAHIGTVHIMKTLKQFRSITAKVCVDTNDVKARCKRDAWKKITTALRDQRTVLLFHCKNHYVLIAGYCQPQSDCGTDEFLENCAIFSNRKGQKPACLIPFSEVADIIRKYRGYKILQVQHVPRALTKKKKKSDAEDFDADVFDCIDSDQNSDTDESHYSDEIDPDVVDETPRIRHPRPKKKKKAKKKKKSNAKQCARQKKLKAAFAAARAALTATPKGDAESLKRELDRRRVLPAGWKDGANGGVTLLHIAAQAAIATSDLTCLNLVLAAPGCAVNAVAGNGRSALHWAAGNDCEGTVVARLLEVGADVGATSDSGRTPLHDAAQNGRVEAGKALVASNDADICNVEDEEGWTPLLLAVDYNQLDFACFLLEAGANGDATTPSGKDALGVALAKGASGVAMAHDLAAKLDQRNFRASIVEARKKWMTDPFFSAHRTRLCEAGAEAGPPGSELVVFTSTSKFGNKSVNDLRCGEYSVMTDQYFEQAEDPDALLYTTIAYCSATPDVCIVDDALVPLQTFELELFERAAEEDAGGLTVDPLFFLAHARVARLRNENALAAAMLENFRLAAPLLAKSVEEDGWLTKADEIEAQDGKYAKRVLQATKAESGLAAKWEKLKYGLNSQQMKPMDELMALTGLERVKEIALKIYSSVLAKQKLKENGRVVAVAKPTLNFAFMGNPGTGKSTVARIFADLLKQAGARAGPNFVKMTASQAIRKGIDKFITELESLTGGDESSGPPSNELRRGMKVEVSHTDSDGKKKWWPGKISFVDKKEKKVSVTYTDGTEETELAMENLDKVRPLGTGRNVGGVLFLDEAYDLDPKNSRVGRAIMAEIMAAAEDHRDKVSIILAGYKDDIEQSLYSFNSGMASRFVPVRRSSPILPNNAPPTTHRWQHALTIRPLSTLPLINDAVRCPSRTLLSPSCARSGTCMPKRKAGRSRTKLAA